MTKIYHNPRCSKSRQTLALLQENNEDAEIIEYLNNSPSEVELKSIIQMLGITPLDLIRKGEIIFKEMYKGKNLTDIEWIGVMVKNPILIERPIVIKNGKAVLGRPPENVFDIL